MTDEPTWEIDLAGMPDETFEDGDRLQHDGDVLEAAIAALDLNQGCDIGWYLDTGASRHVSGNEATFDSLDSNRAGLVSTASSHSHQMAGTGSVSFHLGTGSIKKVDNVLYVPGITKNLLSIGTLTDRGYIACFDRNRCHLINSHTKQIMATGVRNPSNGLYQLVIHNARDSTTTEVNISVATMDVARSWYSPELAVITQPAFIWQREGATIPVHTEVCSSCQQGKQHRESFPKQGTSRASKILELVHVDLCGPMQKASLGGSLYFLVIVDDFSRFVWVKFLPHKSDAFSKFLEFLTMIEIQTGQKLIGIRFDRGTKFLNSEFKQLCKKNGIKHQLTNAYTPEKNGIAKRMNHTLIEKARTMQLQRNTLAFLWSEAVNTTSFLTNRSLASANEGVTPYQKFTGQIPLFSHLRIFGSKMFIYSKDKTTSKWDLRIVEGVLFGYDERTKGFRCWVPTQRN
jgi:hypothetical protein